MIKHCVFLALRDDAPVKDIETALRQLAGLVGQVEGMLDFAHGENRDYEKKSARHGHGFIVTFRDREAHLAYEAHPLHKAAGNMLIALCRDGYEGIMVYDLETA